MNSPLNGQQPQQPENNKQVHVVFDVDVWNIILVALADAPWKNVAQVIPEMRRQIEGELALRRSFPQQELVPPSPSP